MSMIRHDGAELRERAPTPGIVNLDRFEADFGRVPSPPTSPDTFAKRTQVGGLAKHSPLQSIADAIKRLVWDDNEKLGQMISEHYGEGNSGSMAAAVQSAANDLLAEGKDQ